MGTTPQWNGQRCFGTQWLREKAPHPFFAPTTCHCNDIYREASKRGLRVERAEVEVEGDFGAEGEPAKHATYRAKVTAHASGSEIHDLMAHTDRVAEVHNALRAANPVTLAGIAVIAR